MKNYRAILVGTADRGLYYGWVPEGGPTNLEIKDKNVELFGARMIVRFRGQGALSLAAAGPTKDCRVGPRADIVVGPVLAIAQVSAEAVMVLENYTWK